jgi:Cd2+/Zn2+-exporting ATPase
MNLLMVVAVAGALALGEWLEAATVAFLFALSLALEAWSVGRARRAITALLALEPEQARVLAADRSEAMVEARSVPAGTRFLVRPGERIPLDGDVVAGSTSVDQAPITGESVPVARGPGDPVLAGTINHEGALEVVATRDGGDTVLAHVVRSVRDALGQRSPSEQWVDAFARWYTPLVVLAAVLVALVPPLLGGDWNRWWYEALVLLVIACPCALVISTPVSIVSGLAAAARHGVLVKGGAVLELAARLRAVAFDKTGTVTRGVLAVTDVVPLSGHDAREVLEIAAGIEQRSEHPIGRAIVAHAAAAGIAAEPVAEYRAFPGRGAEARRAGRPVWIGSHRFLEERGEEPPELHDLLEDLARAGSTVVVVGEEHHVCGAIAVADQLRPESPAAVRELAALGIERIVLLTGDNRPTGEAIAALAGIREVRADLLPQDKVAAVAELVERHGAVAMVGDGVNDAPALARASLGVAMGAAGSDVALETADVALMQDDLLRLPWLVRLGRRTRAIIRQNVVASLAVKAAFVGLALAGLGSLWGAIAADMGMSLLVVGNALRLLRIRA